MTELQLKVMRLLWKRGELRAVEVQEQLRPSHDLAITTVSTLLSRMARRGDISARRDGRHVYFSAQVSEADLSARKLNEVADLLFAGNTVAAISHLVDTTALDAGELRALQKQLAAKAAEKRRK